MKIKPQTTGKDAIIVTHDEARELRELREELTRVLSSHGAPSPPVLLLFLNKLGRTGR
jgi:hypothetical protein